MEQLNHFSHEHPLILIELNENHAQADVVCYGCNTTITKGSFTYTCNSSSSQGGCDHIFLHKTCAELPQIVEHPMHLEHPVNLSSRPHYNNKSCICSICRESGWKWFTYECIPCEFDVCLRCALEEYMFKQQSTEKRIFRHESHKQHTLTLVQKTALFQCDACDCKDDDLSYLCTTCPFWIHKSCASAPSTMEYCRFHDHPLRLAYSLPKQFRSFPQLCSICGNKVHHYKWLYYCANCRFFAHIKCATSTEIEPSMISIKNVEDAEKNHLNESNKVHFPLTDAIEKQFIKAISLTDDTAIAPDYMDHWAHKDHPLVLSDQLKKSNTIEMANRDDDQMLCDGCVRSILIDDQFYGCVQCNFFLHKYCAELPPKLQHASHPEHELFRHKYTEPIYYIKCYKCGFSCNGIFFYCKSCQFFLDLRCASLPDTIKHEGHKHPLSQLEVPAGGAVCKGCEYKFSESDAFACKVCDFLLAKSCTFMPSMVRHRWDPHPIPLLYPPVKNHPDEFYCEICEEEINPNYWLYHCHTCDQSFHPTCLYPYYAYSNIKFGAANIKVDDHPHRLTFVGMEKHNFYYQECQSCGDDIPDGQPVYACESCRFQRCVVCYPDL